MELAFCHSSSISVECEWCGRVHFCDRDLSAYDEGDYERYKQGESQQPEAYIPWPEDSIRYGVFGGKQFVFECPCNAAAMIENALMGSIRDISELACLKAEVGLKQAQFDSESAEAFKNALGGG